MPSVWQVDKGGAIGFRNSPDLKDACDQKVVAPAKALSKWEAAEETDGWIKCKANGLFLPTIKAGGPNGGVLMEKLEDAPAPAAPAAPPPGAFSSFTCLKKNQARAGFEMESDKGAVMAAGAVIAVLEAKVNEAGVLRIKFEGGWVSERTASGIVCWEGVAAPKPELSEEDALALEEEEEEAAAAAAAAGGKAPATAPAPAPEPAPAPYKKGKVVMTDYTTPDLIRKCYMWMWRGKDWVKVRTACQHPGAHRTP